MAKFRNLRRSTNMLAPNGSSLYLAPGLSLTGSNGVIVRGWAMAATVAVCAAQITNSLRHLIYADFTG
jgi:hypothetical protein